MDSDCDGALRISVPAARAAVIQTLYSDYKMNQLEISRKLGITQAAVSKCIKRSYSRNISLVCRLIRSKGIESAAAKSARNSTTSKINAEIDRIASKPAVLNYALKLLSG